MIGHRGCWRARVVLAAYAVAALGGCARWEPQPLVPQAVIDREHPQRLRVTRTDSSQVELQKPRVENDTLKGMAHRGPTSVPLSMVAYVSVRRGNRLPLILAVSLGVAAGVFILIGATYND